MSTLRRLEQESHGGFGFGFSVGEGRAGVSKAAIHGTIAAHLPGMPTVLRVSEGRIGLHNLRGSRGNPFPALCPPDMGREDIVELSRFAAG